jgi:hypothetical protein
MPLLRALNLVAAILAVLAPAAHVLEMPNKLLLDGTTWLVVQQNLYRGWGPFLAGPSEIVALLTSLALLVLLRRKPLQRETFALAAFCYAGMIAAFFLANEPVNRLVSRWTPATLPADWPHYRILWEGGHAASAMLGAIALLAIAAAFNIRGEAALS